MRELYCRACEIYDGSDGREDALSLEEVIILQAWEQERTQPSPVEGRQDSVGGPEDEVCYQCHTPIVFDEGSTVSIGGEK